ncbi:MAG: hypothetical protein ABGY41_18765 [Candidatus Poribacteria bacterium]
MRIDGDIVSISGERYVLATRGQRLIAQLLDGFVYALIVLCQRRWKNPHFAGLEIPSFVWLC